MKYFKKSTNFENEMFVVLNVSAYPVRAIKRHCRTVFTNVSVEENWDKLSTYDVTVELLEAFREDGQVADIGLCSYLAQCIVNAMQEAHLETKANCCDMTMVFGYDFEVATGVVIRAEDVWDALCEYFKVVNWDDGEERLELKLEINVK